MLRAPILALLLFTLATGVIYPLAMVGVGKLVFRDQTEGSLVRENGQVLGSRLIGKSFEDPRYFWSRRSATTPGPYNAAASSGSNYGPLNMDLKKAIESRRMALVDADPEHRANVPIDLLTASGSGLDPHISPEGADYQASRVARARGIPISDVHALIRTHTAGRQWRLFGEPVVNVWMLNRALDGK